MGKYASKVVEQAKSWIGKKESDGTHKTIIDVYNAHKPLARGYKVKYTDAWCSTFVSAVAIKLGYTDIIPTECGCQQHIELFKKLGIWVEDENRTPKAGDIIFYDWQDNGIGDNKGYSDHIGIVEKVSGGIITVIEGNYNNGVGRRKIAVNAKTIRGYGIPKYDVETSEKPNTNETKANNTVKVDAAKSFSKNYAKAYKVIAKSGLNMRCGAGTSKNILTTLKNGATFRCYGYYTKQADGTVWLYGVSGGKTGFCSKNYLS